MPKDEYQSKSGRLVLHSIPTQETEDMVVSYLSRMVKNVPAEKLAQKIKIVPFVLSKNIAVKKGERIAQNLRDLGAKAEFVPHDSGTQVPGWISETALSPEFESILLMSEQHKSKQPSRPGSSSFSKHLITAIVVIILVAVLSFLTWQLHDLLTAKFFR
jgi:hypothetical protein